MRILMLVNWKVAKCKVPPDDRQPPDYFAENTPYWFFRYFKEKPVVDVVDISSFSWLEGFEKDLLRFYIWQTLRVLGRIRNYDVILSHGMQSGVVLSLFRRLFRTKARHIVFDIGSFNSAATSGGALKLMQFASRSIDGVIYHTSLQKRYYEEFFPWIVPKASFIRYGADEEFFSGWKKEDENITDGDILCVGYSKRDWDTLYHAYKMLEDELLIGKNKNKIRLRLIGKPEFHKEDPAICCLPFVPVKKLAEEINRALFCVVPLESFLYSYGQMTLLQQMAMGKAVIAAKVPSLVDYGKDKETLLFYEPGKAEDLKCKMELLLKDGNMRKDLGARAKKAIEYEWNEKKMAAEIENVIHRIVKE